MGSEDGFKPSDLTYIVPFVGAALIVVFWLYKGVTLKRSGPNRTVDTADTVDTVDADRLKEAVSALGEVVINRLDEIPNENRIIIRYTLTRNIERDSYHYDVVKSEGKTIDPSQTHNLLEICEYSCTFNEKHNLLKDVGYKWANQAVEKGGEYPSSAITQFDREPYERRYKAYEQVREWLSIRGEKKETYYYISGSDLDEMFQIYLKKPVLVNDMWKEKIVGLRDGVLVEMKPDAFTIGFKQVGPNGAIVNCRLHNVPKEAIYKLSIGDEVTLYGRISNIEAYYITMTDCQLDSGDMYYRYIDGS